MGSSHRTNLTAAIITLNLEATHHHGALIPIIQTTNIFISDLDGGITES